MCAPMYPVEPVRKMAMGQAWVPAPVAAPACGAAFRRSVPFPEGCGEEPLGPASAMPDWVTAKATAGTDLTKMVYAVSDEGHSVMCPRSLWSHYDQLIRGK